MCWVTVGFLGLQPVKNFEFIACTYGLDFVSIKTVFSDKMCNKNVEKVTAGISEKTNKHVCIIAILTICPFREICCS